MKVRFATPELSSDPDLKVGGILTLERSDGRSVWRCRLAVKDIIDHAGFKFYLLEEEGGK